MENINIQNYCEQLVVSSREVAENFGKNHRDVLKAIDNIKEGCEDLRTPLFIETTYIHPQNKQEYREYLLTEKGLTLYLFNIQGYQEFKLYYINAFDEMKQYIEDLRFNRGDKKHQLHCMAMLGNLLPEDLKEDKVNYMKANNVVNKCISNMYGFEKMVQKGDMSKPMLVDREKCLDDYLKLFEVLQDNDKVSKILHEKYDKKLIEN